MAGIAILVDLWRKNHNSASHAFQCSPSFSASSAVAAAASFAAGSTFASRAFFGVSLVRRSWSAKLKAPYQVLVVLTVSFGQNHVWKIFGC
ncbi:hypothetical protein L195_g003022 [Trifolium pratense]|uniref:Uncharacterized protein n=1 Tax=Trifolium pratense TaxID=57577 RepID=A0A2K3NU58_TRIPR|nr:hypothetical protein L195_g003022 [Trifolium pratense]